MPGETTAATTWATFAGALLAAVVAVLSFGAPAAGAATYWGATIHGEVYGESGAAPLNQTAWRTFERHAGKQVSVLSMGQRWENFEEAKFDAARDGGAIPLAVMALPSDATLAEVAAGDHDATIRSWAREARAWSFPFMLAPWWEMNGSWYHWGQDPDFVAAWRRFHDLVEQEGATNVTWTWVPNSIWFDPASNPEPYYPGDDYVDWIGFDVYNWGRNPLQPDRWLSPAQTLTPMIRRLREIAPDKPIAVCENASTEIGGNKASWIGDLLDTYLPHHPEIKAYVWFNWNVFQNGGRFDWQIESSLPAQQAFRNGIQSSYYRAQPPALPALTKVPVPPAPPAGPAPREEDLSAGGGDAGEPQLAVSADGASLAVWQRSDGEGHVIEARHLSAAGSQTGVLSLSEPGEDAFVPQVAISPDGIATAAWIRFDGDTFVAEARRIQADGTVSPAALTLSAPGRNAGEPQVAVAGDGAATVVWTRFDGSRFVVQARRLSPTGEVDPVTLTLSAPGENASEPQIAVADDGTATVAWTRFDGSNEVVQGRRISPEGVLDGTTHQLSAPGEDAGQPQLDAAPDGATTVVWNRPDGEDSIIQARRIETSGALGATVDLSATGGDAAEPQVSIGPGGAATAVWSRFNGSAMTVQARRLAADGAASGIHTLSAPDADAAEPQLTLDPAGFATVVWTGFDGSDFVVRQRRLAPDGSPAGGSTTVSAPGEPAGAAQVATQVGNAPSIVWRRSNGARDIVQGVLPPPPLQEEPPPEPEQPPAEEPPPLAEPAVHEPPIVNSRGTSSSPEVTPKRGLLLGRPRLISRRGAAVLPVIVPGPGTLGVRGRGVTSSRSGRRRGRLSNRPLRVTAAGTVKVKIEARGRAKRRLRRRGRVRVTVTVVFHDVRGVSDTRRVTLTLRQRTPGAER